MKFTIVLYSNNNLIPLKRCLDALLANYLNRRFPILIMTSDSDETTKAFLKTYKERNGVELLNYSASEEYTSVAKARNAAAKLVDTPYIGFLCDSVEVSEHYLLKAVDIINTHSPDVFGGPQVTHPNSNKFQQAVGEVYTSELAMGPNNLKYALKNRFQTGVVNAREYHLSSCNIWMKTQLFINYGICFDQRLTQNSERVLLHQLNRLKKKILFCPDFYIYGQRSNNIWGLMRDTFLSSRYLTYSLFLYPQSFNPIYLIPSVLLIYFLFLPFIGMSPLVYALGFYFALSLYFSVKLCVRSGNYANIFLNIFFHLILNFSYAIGSLTLLFRRPKVR